MSNVADFESNLADANTTFVADFDAIFGQTEQPPGSWQLITEIGVPADGEKISLVFADDLSEVREWTAGESKVYDGARSYSLDGDLRTWYVAKRLSRKKVTYDKSGAVSRQLTRFLQRNSDIINKIVWDHITANPTCYDGVSLVSSSHPNGPAGATQSNSTSDALSHSSFRAGVAAMKSLQMENGSYFNLNPKILIVHPDDEDVALEVTAANNRLVAIDNTGAEATSGVVAGTNIENVYAGRVSVVLEPRLTSGDWLLVDNGIAGVRPFYLSFGREIEPIEATDMDDYVRRSIDMLEWALETDLVRMPGHWQAIYGKLS